MADMLKQADDMQSTIDQRWNKMSAHHRADGRGDDHCMVGKMKDMIARHRRIAGQHQQFRRFLPPDPQLPLLGTALLQHSRLLGAALDLRHPRRHRHDDRRHPADLIPDMERLDALMPQMVALMPSMIATMKNMKTYDADHVWQTQKGMQDQMSAMQDNSIGHGRGLRRRPERRLVLSAAGDLRERRLQARHEELPVPQRTCGALHHQP